MRFQARELESGGVHRRWGGDIFWKNLPPLWPENDVHGSDRFWGMRPPVWRMERQGARAAAGAGRCSGDCNDSLDLSIPAPHPPPL